MSTLKERLEEAIKEAKVTKTAIWKACGLSSGAVSQWFSGSTQKIEGENLLNAARVLGVTPEWLATGKGRMKKLDAENFNDESQRSVTPSVEDGAITINQYNDAHGSMGSGLILHDQPGQITGWKVTPEWIDKNLPSNSGRSNLSIVTGFGDSMKGMYNSGDPIIIDVGITSCDYDGVYFFRIGDEGFIKTLQRIPGDGIRVISENKKYENWTITGDMDFEVFGRVLKVWKSEEF